MILGYIMSKGGFERMFKPLLKGALAVAFAIVSAPVFAFYSDMDENHWAYKQIKTLSDSGVLVGYPDGSFQPDENVTRAEFASMAIKALGQEHTNVVQPINYSDVSLTYWAYDSIQKAVYFDLISNDKTAELFRPEDSVSRAETISIAVNALTTEQISEQKAKDILRTYQDAASVSADFLIAAGKAEILNMITIEPSRKGYLDAERPATRAEVAAILYNMTEQAKLNPNAKLAEAMRKKTGNGFVIDKAYVQGSTGVIPAGSVIPVKLGTVMGSQISERGDLFIAKAPQNYITKDKYILIYKDSDIKGQVKNVVPGKLFFKNGELVLDSTILVTPNDQAVVFKGESYVENEKSRFMEFIRKIFKGDKIMVLPDSIVYVRLLQPIRVDLTNGWIYENSK